MKNDADENDDGNFDEGDAADGGAVLTGVIRTIKHKRRCSARLGLLTTAICDIDVFDDDDVDYHEDHGDDGDREW